MAQVHVVGTCHVCLKRRPLMLIVVGQHEHGVCEKCIERLGQRLWVELSHGQTLDCCGPAPSHS